MTWVERPERRTRTGKVWQDSADPQKFALDATLAPLHFESVVDSGVYDAPIDATPQRVNVASFDGWRISQNGWHYALGKDLANHGSEDGWVGFGGRQGQHWFKFRLARVGYLHWPARAWTDIGGAPNYARANLTSETHDIEFATDGSTQPIESVANWRSLWATPGGGSLDVSWRVNGDQLKEEVVVNQAGRDWLTANRPPTTPLSETWFGFVFRLDWSDVPKVVRRGILQDTAGDFADDGEPVELRDALDRLLAFMPVDDLIVRGADGEEIERVPLRKRFYRDSDGNNYLLVGVRCDTLVGLPGGDLVFDPTIDAQVGAGADDAIEDADAHVEVDEVAYEHMCGDFAGISWSSACRFAVTIPSGATIDSAYQSFYPTHSLSGTINYTYYGQDGTASSSAFSNTSPNRISDRTKTTANVNENPPANWTASTWVNSPELKTIIQELGDTYDYSGGGYIVLMRWYVSGLGERRAQHYEGSAANAAKLHIEYSEGGGGSTELEVQDASHAHSAEAPALVQAHLLTVASASHAHAAENVALLQAYTLAIADAAHTHASESPALTQAYLLAVQDADHVHASETVALTQAQVLAVADAEHIHAVESPDLVQAQLLAVDAAEHAHGADSVDLLQAYLLAVQNAEHAHPVDNADLLQAYLLAVADAEHGHEAENVTLSLTTRLAVQDADHAHASESPALTQGFVLTVADAAHAHTSESAALIQAYVLTVEDAAHAHSVDNIDFAAMALLERTYRGMFRGMLRNMR